MQLSENFRLKEFVESQTADERGIDNRPDWEAVINLRNLCREVLQPLRNYEGKPIHANSGYRCPELNEAVHGVGDSQHLYGEAADLHVPNIDTGRRWYQFIVEHTDFDQVLFEYRRTGVRWLHVSCRRDRKRDLPLTSFERFKTGTYRKMCWQCRWALNGKGVRKRSLLRHETG